MHKYSHDASMREIILKMRTVFCELTVKPISINGIVEKKPQKGNFLAKRKQCNKKCNHARRRENYLNN